MTIFMMDVRSTKYDQIMILIKKLNDFVLSREKSYYIHLSHCRFTFLSFFRHWNFFQHNFERTLVTVNCSRYLPDVFCPATSFRSFENVSFGF